MQKYYHLSKPGIIYGNALTAAAGFLLASRGDINLLVFIAMLLGISLVIAAACASNNVLDIDIDKKMPRTRRRALVTGAISRRNALVYAAIILSIGTALLLIFTNTLTAVIALLGFVFYVAVYGYAKRRSVYGTEAGSIAGAVPITVGYVAVAGSIDLTATILFLALVFWQMPHFYGIALYRAREYAAAAIPVLPLKKGVFQTKIRTFVYIAAFLGAIVGLTATGATGYIFLSVMSLATTAWVFVGLKNFRIADDALWGRQMFTFSLQVLLAFSLLLSVDAWVV